MHQAEGSVQDLYGQAKDAAGEAINAVGKMPASSKTPFATTSKINHIRLEPSLLLSAGLLAGHTVPSRGVPE